MSAGYGDLSLHAHTKRPTFHSHSEGSLVLVPLLISITLHVIVVNICCSNNTYSTSVSRFNNLVISPMPSKALTNIFTL